MRITKARIIGCLITAMLALSAPVVFADSGNGGNWGDGQWGHHGHDGNGGFFHHLTDEQKKQLKDIWQKQKEAKRATFEQIKADKEALTNELLQTTPDVNKINDLKSKIEALGAQTLDDRINSDLKVKKILTAEQFAKYLEFQKHQFGRSHKGEWGHNGQGWGHWSHCRHHHRHHHGSWGSQRDGGYAGHHNHWGDDGDND